MRSTGLRIKRGERRGQCVREGAEAAAGVTSLAAGRLREGRSHQPRFSVQRAASILNRDAPDARMPPDGRSRWGCACSYCVWGVHRLPADAE